MRELIILAFASLSCANLICSDENYGKQHLLLFIFYSYSSPTHTGHQPLPIVDEYINSTIESGYEIFDNPLSTNVSVYSCSGMFTQ